MAGIQENIDELRGILEDVYELTGMTIEVAVNKFEEDHPENAEYYYTIYDATDGQMIVIASNVEYDAVLTFISGLVTGYDYIKTKMFNKISLN